MIHYYKLRQYMVKRTIKQQKNFSGFCNSKIHFGARTRADDYWRRSHPTNYENYRRSPTPSPLPILVETLANYPARHKITNCYNLSKKRYAGVFIAMFFMVTGAFGEWGWTKQFIRAVGISDGHYHWPYCENLAPRMKTWKDPPFCTI